MKLSALWAIFILTACSYVGLAEATSLQEGIPPRLRELRLVTEDADVIDVVAPGGYLQEITYASKAGKCWIIKGDKVTGMGKLFLYKFYLASSVVDDQQVMELHIPFDFDSAESDEPGAMVVSYRMSDLEAEMKIFHNEDESGIPAEKRYISSTKCSELGVN